MRSLPDQTGGISMRIMVAAACVSVAFVSALSAQEDAFSRWQQRMQAQAQAQKPLTHEQKMAEVDRKIAMKQACRFSSSALIGLTEDELRAKCGGPSDFHTTTTAGGVATLLIYKVGTVSLFDAYLYNGIVGIVQSY